MYIYSISSLLVTEASRLPFSDAHHAPALEETFHAAFACNVAPRISRSDVDACFTVRFHNAATSSIATLKGTCARRLPMKSRIPTLIPNPPIIRCGDIYFLYFLGKKYI